MQQVKKDVIIIGGGLTGMTLCYLLLKSNINCLVLEARTRLGGRIHTLYDDNSCPVEMGATWIGRKHRNIHALLGELGLNTFPQELGTTAFYEPISTSPPQLVDLPYNEDPSYRIRGGSSMVIEKLEASIPSSHIIKNQLVKSITQQDANMEVKTQDRRFTTQHVVSTLPPGLFLATIKTHPDLPDSLEEILATTHTWMGESVKFSLSFSNPFWNEKGLSGTLFSNVGPIPEMYDHTDFTGTHYALKGFINSAYAALSLEERKSLVLTQLKKYYGSRIDNYISYSEKVWQKDPLTYTPYRTPLLPHQNNGHPIYRQSYMGGRLHIAGSETSVAFPGYMDGAVSSAIEIAQRIKESIMDSSSS